MRMFFGLALAIAMMTSCERDAGITAAPKEDRIALIGTAKDRVNACELFLSFSKEHQKTVEGWLRDEKSPGEIAILTEQYKDAKATVSKAEKDLADARRGLAELEAVK